MALSKKKSTREETLKPESNPTSVQTPWIDKYVKVSFNETCECLRRSLLESRMRENRTYGLTRGKGMNSFLYSTAMSAAHVLSAAPYRVAYPEFANSAYVRPRLCVTLRPAFGMENACKSLGRFFDLYLAVGRISYVPTT